MTRQGPYMWGGGPIYGAGVPSPSHPIAVGRAPPVRSGAGKSDGAAGGGGSLWDPIGAPMGSLWGLLRVPMEVLIGSLWGPYGGPVGALLLTLWDPYGGVPMGAPMGVIMGVRWGSYGCP